MIQKKTRAIPIILQSTFPIYSRVLSIGKYMYIVGILFQLLFISFPSLMIEPRNFIKTAQKKNIFHWSVGIFLCIFTQFFFLFITQVSITFFSLLILLIHISKIGKDQKMKKNVLIIPLKTKIKRILEYCEGRKDFKCDTCGK